MSVNVSMTGLRETLEGLAETEKDMQRAARRANLRGGEVVVKELSRQAPRGTGEGKHMRQSVVMSGNKTDKNTYESYVDVGFPKGVAFRTHFPLGTIKQAPDPYFERTVRNAASEVNSVMASEIMRVLR